MTDNKHIEDLLKPRYKVIEPYPHSPFTVGDILVEQDLGATDNPFYRKERFGFVGEPSVYNPESYPANFKELQWWEEREEKDMPRYVSNIAKAVYRAVFMASLSLGEFTLVCGEDITQAHFSNYLPATEKQYNEYIQKQKS